MSHDTVIGQEELAQMQARADRASAGPWKAFIEGRDHESGSSFIMMGPEEQRGDDIELSGATDADFDFISHARQDVPRLIRSKTAARPSGEAR